MDLFSELSWFELFLSGCRLSTPLLFAALGGLLSEKSGVANIALEGFLLVGAFTAAAVTYSVGDPWLGLLGALFAGGLAASIFGFLTVFLKADHIVIGTASNLLALGVIPLLCRAFYKSPGSTPALQLEQRLSVWFFFFTAITLAFVIWFLIYRTRYGLRIRAAGENMEASESVGISIAKIRFSAVLLSGVLASAGGAFLSIAHGSQYTRAMSAGRGFIALAALILAAWRPLPVILTCLVFGITDAAQIVLQSYKLPSGLEVPVQFIQMLPYAVTLIVLIGFVGRTIAPRDIGKHP